MPDAVWDLIVTLDATGEAYSEAGGKVDRSNPMQLGQAMAELG